MLSTSSSSNSELNKKLTCEKERFKLKKILKKSLDSNTLLEQNLSLMAGSFDKYNWKVKIIIVKSYFLARCFLFQGY